MNHNQLPSQPVWTPSFPRIFTLAYFVLRKSGTRGNGFINPFVNYFYFIYEWVWICVNSECVLMFSNARRVSDPLELKLQAFCEPPHVGAGIQT